MPKQRIPKVILLIESSRASGRALLKGIANYAHHYGPWSFYWEPAGLEKAWPLLKTLDADGIILRDVDKLDEVLAFGMPAVVVGHSRPEVSGLVNVITDSAAIGRMAAEHLLSCGFRHFAFVGYAGTTLEHTPWSKLRQEAFRERIVQAGFTPPAEYIISQAKTDWANERRALAQWLDSLPKPVGLMACNDDCGQQVMEACKLANITVPDMVGVIGADNDEVVCGLADPPMSSVGINFERAGYEAAQALDGLMRGLKRVPQKIVATATNVFARRSTDVIAVEDKPLAKALRFIRDNARQPMSVEDVARAAGLSRRALEKRFRNELGQTVLEAIRRARIQQISQLLIQTQMPISQVAEALGFADFQHFARYFKASTKMTPREFRKKFGAHPG
ncbi:MAG: XylR family transcriptional regulator [Verrucomicrobiae bacterium]|nr:XylR family transcriptional regulator [Verrucomicrobiae bacterium]MCX7722319.1 XylR family transcriptional regulator [Verrucomicrobiae bacterium]